MTNQITDTTLEKTWTIQKISEIFKNRAEKFNLKEFIILPENENSIFQITSYFLKPDEFSGDLSKGIMLLGPIGTGKTTLIKMIQSFLSNTKNYFKIAESRHILRDFMISGMSEIDRYGRLSFKTKYNPGTGGQFPDIDNPLTYCFDDLGLENTDSSLYGNKANVIAEIMLDRYNGFTDHGMITHAISNLDPATLSKLYGDRASDRFMQMFNVIILTGKSLRK